MKHLNFKVLLALVAGLFLFSCCSNEDDIINNVNAESSLNAEEAAFQDLLVKLEALNAEYGVTPQTRIVGPQEDTWLKRTFGIVSKGVLGGVTAFRRNLYEQICGACATSIKARNYYSTHMATLGPVFNNELSDLYLSRIGYTANDFDKAGRACGMAIDRLFRLHEGVLFSMTDVQLKNAITQQVCQLGYSIPPDYNPTFRPLINFTLVNNILDTNNYPQTLQYFMNNNLITNYEYNTVISFLRGLSSVTEDNILDYCVYFRNFVYNSDISSFSKNNIYSIVSIGFVSAHLWVVIAV